MHKTQTKLVIYHFIVSIILFVIPTIIISLFATPTIVASLSCEDITESACFDFALIEIVTWVVLILNFLMFSYVHYKKRPSTHSFAGVEGFFFLILIIFLSASAYLPVASFYTLVAFLFILVLLTALPQTILGTFLISNSSHRVRKFNTLKLLYCIEALIKSVLIIASLIMAQTCEGTYCGLGWGFFVFIPIVVGFALSTLYFLGYVFLQHKKDLNNTSQSHTTYKFAGLGLAVAITIIVVLTLMAIFF